MLYDAYENKIRKRYQYFKLIHRFRILIATIIIFIVSLTTAFFITKGMVYGIEYQDTLTYGEKLNISSNSFLSSQTYTYSVKGENNFNSKIPSIPGNYDVKISTLGVFGKREKIVDFKIKEKDIQVVINKEEVEFGENPFDTNITLAFGDYIHEIEYKYIDPSNPTSEIELSRIVIHNSEHEDVTNFYNINTNVKKVDFVQRKISVELLNYTAVYDGEDHINNDFKVASGSLVQGHRIELTSTGTLNIVSKIKNKIEEIIIYDENDVDVTVNYDITRIDDNSTIELTKRPLTIELVDMVKEYDSTPLTSNQYKEISELELLKGHRVVVLANGTITNFGSTKNDFSSVIIYDEFDNDVTDNYVINKVSGNLSITKYQITVNTASSEKMYDGIRFIHEEMDGDVKLFNDDKLVIAENSNHKKTNYINVGTYKNNISYVVKSNGEISENYEITVVEGLLTITKRNITFESYYYKKVYDGLITQSDEGLKIIEGSLTDFDTFNNKHDIDYINVSKYKNVIEALIYRNDVLNNDNYEITYEYAIYEIYKREVTLKPVFKDMIYNGLSLKSNEVFVTEGDLAVTDTINSIITNGEIIDYGIVDNEIIENGVIIFNQSNEDVTINYEFKFEKSELEILKRPITIKPVFKSKIYDGILYESNEVEVLELEYGLVLDHIVNAYNKGSIFYVGRTGNIIESHEIVDELGRDKSNNYDVTYLTDELEITPRPIELKSLDEIKVYDGLELSKYQYEIVEGNLVLKDYIEVVNGSSILNVDKISNRLEYIIFDELGKDISINYEIIENEFGELEITPREITIRPTYKEKIYDGFSLFSEILEYEYIDSLYEVIETDTINIYSNDYIIDVGTIINNIFRVEIINEFGQLNNDNYDIKTRTNELKVFEREITVETASASIIYNGHYYSNSDLQYNQDDLALYQSIQIKEHYNERFIDVGTYENYYDFIIYDNNFNDVTKNYIIDKVYGEIIISKFELNLSTNSETRPYNGLELKDTTINNIESVQGLDQFNILLSYSITDVGYIENEIIFEIMGGYSRGEVSGNYDINFEFGTLTVIERKIAIQVDYVEKEYDGISLESNEVTVLEGDLGLVLDHKISVVTNGTITNVGQADNEIISHEIISGDNVDKNSNYDVAYIHGELKVFERKITIIPTYKYKIYDGLVLKSNQLEIYSDSNKLVLDHYLEGETIGSIVNFGTEDNFIEKHFIYDSSGVNQNNNYDVSFKVGTLEIQKCTIKIKTESDHKEYDGTPLFNEGFEVIEGNIVAGDEITVTSHTEITMTGEADNVLTYQITNSKYGDITENYFINHEYGKLIITRKNLIIRPKNKVKEYDGTEFRTESNEYEILNSKDNLIDGHTIEIYTDGIITYVGKIVNKITSIVIRDENGEDITDIYELELETGILEVKPQNIEILTVDYSKTYDSNYFYKDEFNLTNGTYADGEEGFVEKNDHHTDYFKAGSHVNKFDITIRNSSGEDVTRNYEIKYSFGTLTINKLKLTIETNTKTKVYDGLSLSDETLLFPNAEIQKNDKVTITNVPSIINVGEIENKVEFEIYSNIDGSNSINNYDITYNYGTLTITHYEITITPRHRSKIYDGLKLLTRDNEYEYVDGSNKILSGNRLIIQTDGEIINFGVVENNIINVFIYSADGEDITRNYKVNKVSNELEIFKREVNIRPKDEEKIYDGYELFALDFEYTSDEYEIVATEIFNYVILGSIINVGKQVTSFDIPRFKVTKLNGDDSTNNYSFIISEGELTVIPRDIKVKTGTQSKEYDDKILFDERFELINGELVLDDKLFVETRKEVIDVGVYKNYLTLNVNKDITSTSNYNITYEEGMLEITEKVITIKTYDAEKTYDGKALFNEDYDVIGEGFIDGHEFIISNTYYNKFINAGIYDNIFDFKVEKEGNDITKNYNIVFNPGKITIHKANLKLEDIDKEYKYEDSNKFSLDMEIEDYKLVIKFTLSDKIIGTYNSISIDSYSIKSQGKELKDNYNLVKSGVKIEIIKRQIEIELEEAKKEYDGTPLTSNKLKPYKALDNHIVEVEADGIITNVGSIENNITKVRIYNANTKEDVTENYEIEKVSGLLKVFAFPLIFKAKDYSAVYDGKLHQSNEVLITKGKLLNGDKLIINTSKEIRYAGSIDNIIDSYKIIDINGNDVTANYDTIAHHTGKLEVTKRLVQITPLEQEVIYDGTNHENSDGGFTYTKGSLYEFIAGQRITITTRSEEINVGIKVNKIINTIVIDEFNVDATNSYYISYLDGIINIQKREVTIKIEDYVMEYNGIYNKHISHEVIIGNVVTGEILEEVESSVLEFLVAGIHENIYDFKITRDMEDSTNNYEITVIAGKFEITKLTIEIDTASDDKIYDGIHLINDELTVRGMMPSDETSIIKSTSIINVGMSKNIITLEIFNKLRGQEIDVTDSYIINWTYGDLEITKREVYLKPEDQSKVYDGEKLISEKLIKYDGEYDIVSTDTVTFTSKSITNVGKIDNIIDKDSIIIRNNDGDIITDNYDINLFDGNLEITKREIIIKLEDESKVYDGEPLTSNKFSIISDLSLVEGHEIELEVMGSQTEVGDSDNIIISHKIFDNDNIMNDNYSHEYINGKLTILYSDLEIKLKDKSKVYDGNELVSNEFDTTGNLPEGFRIEVFTEDGITEPGKITNEISEYIIYDKFGNDVTDYFNVTLRSGTLTVMLEVEVQIYQKEFYYDGQVKSFLDKDFYYSNPSKRPLNGYVMELTIEGSIKNVGEVESKTTLAQITNDKGDNINEFLILIINESKIKIHKRSIRIKTDSRTKTYDGSMLQSHNFEIDRGELAGDEVIELVFSESSHITEPGSVLNMVDEDKTVISGFDGDVTNNYHIEYEYGTLTIDLGNKILYIEEQLDLKFRKGFNLRENNSLK